VRATLAAAARAAARWWPHAAHLLPPLWLFAGPLFEGRVLFFRDLTFYYYPNYVFLAKALAQGVWPLWNPASDAGAPFLIVYPLDLALVAALGAKGALAVAPPLHVWIAMCGATRLAGVAGAGRVGAWAAGLFYGASGFLLSTVNLQEMLHAASWAPWVVSAALALVRAPGARAVAALAALAALQLSTLGAETVIQTALLGAIVVPTLPRRRAAAALGAAAALAALLAMPVLLGVRALVAGTPRGEGLPVTGPFAWSAPVPVLLEALLPHLFGAVHAFTEQGYWAQPFFPTGQPYLLSLYVGMGLCVLALAAGGGAGRWRWWLAGALGVALAMGSHGPLAPLLAPMMRTFRSPVKFAFMADLALCVLAGLGVDRAWTGPRQPRAWALVPGALLVVAGAGLALRPDLPTRLFGGMVPALESAQARSVAAEVWPSAFLTSGALALGAGLALALLPRGAAAAAALVGLDLLVVNGAINTTATGGFYALRSEVRALVDRAAAPEPFRWFSYGVAGSLPLRFRLLAARHDSDVWLYYLDRQSLLPRTHVLDGLEGAFDLDRVGWAPPGSTLSLEERTPARFREVFDRLRRANVRWVFSFHLLPDDLVALRGRADLAEIHEPLRLYEVRQPWPRAYWAERPDGLPEAGGPRVLYERIDPHTLRLSATTPPGYLVVLDGHHPDWHAALPDRPLPLLRTHGRYWAVATPGGSRVVTVRFAPAWRSPALALAALGALATLALLAGPMVSARLDSIRAPR
jgi:hypothetical protein